MLAQLGIVKACKMLSLCISKMFRKYCCAVIFQVLHIVFAKMYSFIAFGCIEVVLQMHAFLNKKEYRKER